MCDAPEVQSTATTLRNRRVSVPERRVVGKQAPRVVPRFRAIEVGALAVTIGMVHGLVLVGWAGGMRILVVSIMAMCGSAVVCRFSRGRRMVLWHHMAVIAACAAVVGWLATDSTPNEMLDVVAPATMTMVAIGRYGCHRGGCCYGVPVRVGIVYSDSRLPWSAGRFRGIALAPVQLAEAIGCGIIAIAATLANRSSTSSAAATLVTYAALRTTTEMWRGDVDRGGIGRTNQATLTALAVGVGTLLAVMTIRSPNMVEIGAGALFIAAVAGRCAAGWRRFDRAVPANEHPHQPDRPLTWRYVR